MMKAQMIKGRFVPEARLHQGTFGTVYRAVDTRPPGGGGARYVALCALPAELTTNRRYLEEFERDFERIRELSHPHIARVFDLERNGDRYFVTAEYLDGETLRDVLDNLAPERLDVDEADDIVRAVGGALVYAHERGIVHGRVRAENIVVTKDLDFKLLNFVSGSATRNEPFAAKEADDVRDLAALACVLYCGAPPSGRALPRRVRGVPKRRRKAIERALFYSDDHSGPPGAAVRDFLASSGLFEDSASSSAPREPHGSGVPRLAFRLAAVFVVAGVCVWAFEHVVSVRRQALALQAWVVTAAKSTLERPAGSAADSALSTSPEDEPPARQEASPDAPIRAETRITDTVIVAAEDVSEDHGASASGVAEPARSGAEPPSAAPVPAPAGGRVALSFSRASYVAREGQTVASVDIVRSGDSTVPVKLVWWTSDGTARAEDDYGGFDKRVETLKPGEMRHTLYIPIVSDATAEGDESFRVHLGVPAAGADIGSIGTAQVTIVDDER
jgi:tRNA A-37 threonylcarbamoyl transferase component Bud32